MPVRRKARSRLRPGRPISTQSNVNMKTSMETAPNAGLRRGLSARVAAAAIALAAGVIPAWAGDKPVAATKEEEPNAIRPFQVKVAQTALTDLRRRLAATRWPSQELVRDR